MAESEPAHPTFVSAAAEVQNVRRDRRVKGAQVALSLIAAVAVPLSYNALGEATPWALMLLALGAYFWGAVSLAGTDRGPGQRRLAPARVAIRGGRLHIVDNKAVTSLPLSEVTGGWTERTAEGHAAVLSFSDGRVAAIERASAEEAAALLVEAGAGAHARAVRMRGYREDTGGRQLAGCFLALFAPLVIPLVVAAPVLLVMAILTWSRAPLGMGMTFLAGSSPFLLLTAWMWSKVKPTWIQVGTDGVVLPGFLRSRFVPHGSIVRATCETDGALSAYKHVRLDLRGGGSHKIPAASHEEALVMIDRIQAARRASSEQERARLLEGIARNGRPVSEWRRALASLMTQGGYRTAGHALEEVLRIVEDPMAPREQRVAAALAARPHGGETAQKRIRIAAEACAEPGLRVALTGAATGEIEDAELEALESEGPAGAARRRSASLD